MLVVVNVVVAATEVAGARPLLERDPPRSLLLGVGGFCVGRRRQLLEESFYPAQYLDARLQQVDDHPAAAPDQPLPQRS